MDIGSIFTSKVAIGIYGFVGGLISHYFKTLLDERKNSRVERLAADRALFGEYMEICPEDSPAVLLIIEHDFRGTFHRSSIKEFNRLDSYLYTQKKTFHEKKLDKQRLEFVGDFKRFFSKLNSLASSVNQNYLNCLPVSERDDFTEESKQTQLDIAELQELSDELLVSYRQFVAVMRHELRL